MSALDYMTDEQLKRLRNRLNRAFILLDEYEADCRCPEHRKCSKCEDKEQLMAFPRLNTFEDLELKVLKWSEERGILEYSTPESQFLKAVSEIGELADGLAKGDKPATVDAIGDVLVCLINLCQLESVSITHCLSAAYEQIKDRRGHMIAGGVFVKEGK